ncbi:hypothetical protein NKI19_29960 [Mesorhizobium sp. M0751]|uniref:hypothetical protein n=1 Tax=unclassified Mesorhizobium TaxID=325217 RepID=UPI00333A0D7C
MQFGVDPLKLKFDCSRCKPTVKITLLDEVHSALDRSDRAQQAAGFGVSSWLNASLLGLDDNPGLLGN